MRGFNPLELIYILPAVIFVLTVHEVAHGFMAFKLGDDTAKRDGRLSLNPLRHIDWLGMAMLIFVGFGWAKPVMVDSRKLSDPKRDMAIIAAAGPMINFVTFIPLITIIAFMLRAGISDGYIFNLVMRTAFLSLALGFFNLVPVPPLDGSKIFGALLPNDTYNKVMTPSYVTTGILLILLVTGILPRLLGGLVQNVLFGALTFILGIIT
jgi:Zn-dependent protease